MAQYAPDARFLAGGTDVLVDLKTNRIRVGHLVSLNRIEALKGVEETEEGLRIGALTTVMQLSRAPAVQEDYASLLDATDRMAAAQIRNVATVGGNIAAAVPCADLPPILIAMNASAIIWSGEGEHRVPLEDVFAGPRETIMKTDEVLAGVLVPPPPPRFGAAYARFGLREGNTIAVAAVAAGLAFDEKKGVIGRARVVLGAVAPIPKVARAAGDFLFGRSPDEDEFRAAADVAMDEAEPISDVRGSAEYRRELVGVLTRRALATARTRAEEMS
jgi:carbon-monoxide dehydrogenase medium subunit